jgi:hypothetical protein
VVKKKLVEGLIADAAKLLHDLDRKDFAADCMFWVHLPDEDYWRLIIASPVVPKQGRAAGYKRLNEVLLSIEPSGLALEDISLLDPLSQRVHSLLSLVGGSGRLASGEEWVEFEEGIVYRWNDDSTSADVRCQISENELKVAWDEERKSSGQPALLIELRKSRITLRFHPQHGPQVGIDNVKRPFQIALHRRRQDCQLDWIPRSPS